MQSVTLLRHEQGDQGVFGRLSVGGWTCFSGELPDKNNAAQVSCIPTGLYIVRWTFSSRFRHSMYLVNDVAARAGIRIHSANLMGDVTKGWRAQLNGCIALGERLGYIEGQKALLVSAPAVRQFEALMARKSFLLEIKNV